MLDVPSTGQLFAAGIAHASEIDVESLRGHFFQLDLYWLERDWADFAIVGGALRFGPDRIAIDSEHARKLADKVRATIDSAIAGSVIHRPTHCRQGH